jgi:hypothetical protein
MPLAVISIQSLAFYFLDDFPGLQKLGETLLDLIRQTSPAQQGQYVILQPSLNWLSSSIGSEQAAQMQEIIERLNIEIIPEEELEEALELAGENTLAVEACYAGVHSLPIIAPCPALFWQNAFQVCTDHAIPIRVWDKAELEQNLIQNNDGNRLEHSNAKSNHIDSQPIAQSVAPRINESINILNGLMPWILAPLLSLMEQSGLSPALKTESVIEAVLNNVNKPDELDNSPQFHPVTSILPDVSTVSTLETQGFASSIRPNQELLEAQKGSTAELSSPKSDRVYEPVDVSFSIIDFNQHSFNFVERQSTEPFISPFISNVNSPIYIPIDINVAGNDLKLSIFEIPSDVDISPEASDSPEPPDILEPPSSPRLSPPPPFTPPSKSPSKPPSKPPSDGGSEQPSLEQPPPDISKAENPSDPIEAPVLGSIDPIDLGENRAETPITPDSNYPDPQNQEHVDHPPIWVNSGHQIIEIRPEQKQVIISNFGGVGKGTNPSAATIAEFDTLKFAGSESFTAENLLLTQVGDDLILRFVGIEIEIVLKQFQMENLDNFLRPDASVDLANIFFVGQTDSQDSFDVFDADWTIQQVLNPNQTTFLNNLDNSVSGSENSDDTINGQAGNDTLLGLSGDDALRGGLGNDLLIGGTGNNLLTGDDGFDHFVVSLDGFSQVNDFTVGQDRISLPKQVSFEQLQIEQGSGVNANDTWIRWNHHDLLLLKGVQANLLTADQFVH